MLIFPWGKNVKVLSEMPHTCSLDVAEEGPLDNPRIAKMLNLTKQRIGQLEREGYLKLDEFFLRMRRKKNLRRQIRGAKKLPKREV